jgi:hypothetical protein
MTRLNCWLVALWLWLASRGRAYLWVRRSLHFGGWMAHFGTAHPAGRRGLYVVEYVPPKSRLWSRDNFVLLFRGRYRVWHFRAGNVRSFATMAQVREHIGDSK